MQEMKSLEYLNVFVMKRIEMLRKISKPNIRSLMKLPISFQAPIHFDSCQTRLLIWKLLAASFSHLRFLTATRNCKSFSCVVRGVLESVPNQPDRSSGKQKTRTGRVIENHEMILENLTWLLKG